MTMNASGMIPASASRLRWPSRVGVPMYPAEAALRFTACAWFVVAVAGQLMMAIFVIGFYGRSAARGDFAAWNKVLTHGQVAGDPFGNAVLSLHLLFVAVVVASGALQLVPVVRRIAPRFHRWSGRIYLSGALVMSVGGLIMLWTRGTVGDLSQHIAISINALLIIVFAVLTVRHAIAGRFEVHRRMALRLFLVMGGVWFFRISLMLWIALNQGPAGFDPKSFSGPALTAIAFGQYLVPLAVLELYLRAQRAESAARFAMAGLLVILTLMTTAGIGAASMMLWLPRL